MNESRWSSGAQISPKLCNPLSYIKFAVGFLFNGFEESNSGLSLPAMASSKYFSLAAPF